ncbi:MAG: cytochrome ubiquinol oxidase subunit I [Gammaproteobacteria bacterium]|nr:cytochrome ubiquinol oxidase subunit I [Gammaproteobacteria bacterium]
MMMALDIVMLSRLQFATTAMYHFIFVPLTLGLSVLLGIMETVYVMTNREIWRDMTKFWGVLFGINFAMGVATGVTMEFQFGTNWAYYSHYVGDIFGSILAIEGLMAFFLEATFVGLFFFGWKRLSKIQHLIVTWLVALGSSLSALWILIANAWMQHPVGSKFNFETMRMEITNFSEVFFNPVAQAKFVHTISAGYVTGAMFVMSISAYYLLRKRNIEFAKRSMTVAASFGLATALSVVVLGDESGYLATSHQHMKVAAMEAMWHTEPAPAAITVFGIPDIDSQTTHYKLEIPYLLGLITTRSIDEQLPGIVELVQASKPRIANGMKAYVALNTLQKDPTNSAAKKILEDNANDLGYGLLLKKFIDDPAKAGTEEIDKAAWSTVPNVLPIFFSFRLMVACGFFFILFFGYGFYLTTRRRITSVRWYHRLALYSLPLPWIASELGWFIAENGRQPWVIEGVLPTFMGTSSVTTQQLWTSLSGFIVFYSVLAIVEFYLMVKYIKLGPEGMNYNSGDDQKIISKGSDYA